MEDEKSSDRTVMAFALGTIAGATIIALGVALISGLSRSSSKMDLVVAHLNCIEYEIEKSAAEQAPISRAPIITMMSSGQLGIPMQLSSPKKQFDCRADLSAR